MLQLSLRAVFCDDDDTRCTGTVLSALGHHAMPRRIFEYMAAALPVVTSDLPKSKAMSKRADLRCRGDPKALADALLMLAADPARAIELGLAGRAAVSKDFNREHDAAEFKNL
jgi:glycosyltransferase involved in cell wall biosynthesis